MTFEIVDESKPEPSVITKLSPGAQSGLLVRRNPAKSSLQDTIEMIDVLRKRINDAEKADAGLVREMRVWEERRLELEDRVSKESADMFFPQDMDLPEIIEHLTEMLQVVHELHAQEKADSGLE